MRRVLTLLGKEWRDVRALTSACMALVPVAALVARWLLDEVRRDVWASSPAAPWWDVFSTGAPRWWEPLVPGAIALYGALVAADSVGGEVASRRSDGLALLPVGPWRTWSVKAAFLLVATALFAAWAVLVQTATLWAVDGMDAAAPFLARTGRSAALALPLAASVGATLLVSTLRLRGIAAALVGGGLAAGVCGAAGLLARVLGGSATPWDRGPWEPRSPADDWLIAALPCVALFAAAGLAYVYGRVHLARVLRPLGIAAASLVVALAVPSGVLAHAAFSVEPGGPGVQIVDAWPSPDGRYVAIEHCNRAARTHPSKTFVRDVARGALVEPDCGNFVARPAPRTADGVWTAEGTLRLTRDADPSEQVLVDPSTGAVLCEEELDAADAARTRYRSEFGEFDWWFVLNHYRDDAGVQRARLRHARTSATVELPTHSHAVVPMLGTARRASLVVYFPEPNVLAARRLPEGAEKRLLTSRDPWRWQDVGPLRGDERALLVRHDGAWKALDLETGAVTALPGEARFATWFPVLGDPARPLVYWTTADSDAELRLLDLATGAATTLARREYVTGRALADGRVLLLSRESGTLDLVDRDLKPLGRVWPREEARR